ncbi:MAG: S49 family peptidase [Chloroflexota bacterium]
MSEPQEAGARPADTIVRMVIVYLVIVGIALVAGYYIAVALIPTPKIGIINLQSSVGSLLAEVMSYEIDYVRRTDEIKGVVLIVNSPGGSSSAGQDIYYQIRTLRDEKPVVASVDVLAASAAYHIAVGTNDIYAKPASIIGNVGVIFGQPRPEVLSERIITTGPFKSNGGTATSYIRKLDLLHADFRDNVVDERESATNPLAISPAEMSTGEIWIGVEAMEYGIIDHLGSRLDAIDGAAELAGIENYEVVDVRQELLASLEGGRLRSTLEMYETLENEAEIDIASEQTEWPTFYQLYIPLE